MMAALAACVLLAAPAASARRLTVQQKKQAALQHFAKAEQMREALNGRPAAARSRADYQDVIQAYRRVYYVAPSSAKAHEAVVAVAELLADMGRRFADPALFKNAIGQYEFLRKEYPGSRYRFDALFTEGQIYAEDLDDAAHAKATFEQFLKEYPHHRLAADARKALDDLEAEATAKKKGIKTPRQKEKDQERALATAQPRDPDADARPGRTGKFPLVTGIRHWSTPDYTRVAIDLEEEVKYEAGRIPDPDRIFFDLHNTKLASELVGKSFDVEDGFLRRIRIAQYQVGETRLVLDVDDISDFSAFLLPNPYRLIIDIHGKKPAAAKGAAPSEGKAAAAARDEKPREDAKTVAKAAPAPAVKTAAEEKKAEEKRIEAKKEEKREQKRQEKRLDEGAEVAAAVAEPDAVKATSKPTSGPTFEKVGPREPAGSKPGKGRKAKQEPEFRASKAKPTADGERSLIRALGLKIGRIVIDAGHGGHDTGTIGPRGLQEKDLVLDVALRLGKLIDQRMGAEVVYTRDDDTFIPLETRTAIANKEEADLFLSIHANSSRDESARGIETYYLNFTSSADALEVAARENAVSESSIHELQDLVKKIALQEKIEESREFAGDVQHALHAGLSPKNKGLKDRGVKKAPFVVLIGANMPSILAEVSFVSNRTDEKKLSTPEYRQKIAESLYRGVAKYVSGLSGVKVASKLAKDKPADGQ